MRKTSIADRGGSELPLVHQRRAVVEGRRLLWAIIPLLIGFPCLLLGYMWFAPDPDSPASWTDVAALGSAGFFVLVIVGILLTFSALHLCARTEFVCELDSSQLRCFTPVRGFGESFTLKVADIEKIERQGDELPYHWYIWDKSGRRYWLTSNYGNPVETFVDRIKELNPRIEQIIS